MQLLALLVVVTTSKPEPSDPQLIAWLQGAHLPFDAMVLAFPHAADEQFAGAAYYQSFMMLQLVIARGGIDDLSRLIGALASGAVKPEDAFSHGTKTSAAELESVWTELVTTQSKEQWAR